MPHRYEAFDWYERPDYYDAVFDEGTATEAAFVDAAFRRHATGPAAKRATPSALEPACGSGRLMIAMARRGYRVRGFDLSEGMLALCRARLAAAGVDAKADRKSMAGFAYRERFDLMWNLVSTFRLLPSEADARAHLRCVADALRPGGVYVLGLHLADYGYRRCQHERWTARRGDESIVCNIRSWPADRRTRREPCRARIVATRDDGTVRRLESCWAFRTYDPPQLRALLRSEPRLEHAATYGFDHDIDRPQTLGGDRLDTVLVLRRRA